MAIDDNTVYGLTGAQIKELPGKIEAVKGKAKVLTSADYNYPANNPTCVALWMLPPGMYFVDDGVNAKVYADDSSTNSHYGVHIVTPIFNNMALNIVSIDFFAKYSAGSPIVSYWINQSGVLNDSMHKILDSGKIVDNLTSTSNSLVLSAAQGKALKDLIDALDTALGAKANSADVYTKAQVDAAVAGADNVVYIPMTITSVQDMTFSTTETSTEIAAMMDAGKKVMYRMTIPVSVAGLAPGVYDFTAQYHWAGENNAIIIDSVMSGVLGYKCMGIAHHSGNVGQIDIYFLQEKLTNDNKLGTQFINTSGSVGKKFVLVTTNIPTSSTYGEVGDIYVCKLNCRAFVCTAASEGTYTWREIIPAIPTATQSAAGLMSVSDKTKLDGIPTVNNATLTIQRNGSTVQTFTANSSTNKTANIEVPDEFTSSEWNTLWT